MSTILSIMIRLISRYYSSRGKQAGVQKGQTGSITLVQRYGGACKLNVHFHTLMIEGVYEDQDGKAVFHRLSPPTDNEVRGVLQTIQDRVIRCLKKSWDIWKKRKRA